MYKDERFVKLKKERRRCPAKHGGRSASRNEEQTTLGKMEIEKFYTP
jgi:hypothetical protein